MTTPGAEPYFFWFTGASVQALYDQLSAADPATCRLEVRPRGSKCFLRVIRTSAGDAAAPNADQPEINDSWLCPPACPGT